MIPQPMYRGRPRSIWTPDGERDLPLPPIGGGAEFPMQGSAARMETIGISSGDTTLTAIDAGGTINTKGSWVQLIAACAFDVVGFIFYTFPQTSNMYLIDIGVGASSSEKVLIPNICTSDRAPGTFGTSSNGYIPMSIPEGTRISARCQTDVADNVVKVGLTLFGADFIASQPFQRATDYGINLSDSSNLTIDGGATANTKGSWAELTAACDNNLRAVLLMLNNEGVFSLVDAQFMIDLGVGAAGSEKIVIPDVYMTQNGVCDVVFSGLVGALPVNIPGGSRIAARCQSSSGAGNGRNIGLSIIGFD